VGAAAVLYRVRPTGDNQVRILRYKLGKDSEYSTRDAEAVGCILALWLLRGEDQLSDRSISLYTDSQAFIQSMGARRARTGSYLTDELIRIAEQIIGRATRGPITHRVKIRWIAAHINVVGNERADREARLAASGETTASTHLPRILKRRLPLNAELIKEKMAFQLGEEWKDNWTASPRKTRMDAIDPGFPYDKFRKMQHKFTRAQCSLLFQLQSNHLPLNVYLNRIGKAETKYCDSCCTIRNIDTAETVTHFLFECPSYDYERHSLDAKLGHHSRDLRTILSNKEDTSELLRFVGRTRRLQPTLGDVSKFRIVIVDQQDG
jgi:ribonuclease HI